MLCSHLRRGSAYTASKVRWFLNETWKRVPPKGEKKMRADSGFFSREVVRWCESHDVVFGITADQTKPLMQIITGLAEGCWQDLERYGVAQVAEVRYTPVGWKQS
jgi:Transposase DDE domain group 1